MNEIKIGVPPIMAYSIVLKGVREPDTTLIERLLVINYKVGSMNEHLFKHHRLASNVQLEEFKVNLAETMCHCLTLAMSEGWDVSKLINLGWSKIGDRFKDFERTGVWADRSIKL